MSRINLKNATSPSTLQYGFEYSLTEMEVLIQPSNRLVPITSSGGIDIIISDPRKYIQISYTLDFFLSHGQFPTNSNIPPHLSSRGETEGSIASGFADDLTSGGASDTMAIIQRSQNASSNFHIRPSSRSSCTGSSPELNEVVASDEVRICSPKVPVVLTDDSFGQPGINPNDFSFEDFMIDGQFRGIEQLQNRLHSYPGWP